MKEFLINLGVVVLIHEPHLAKTKPLETITEKCSIVILVMNNPQYHGIALKIDYSSTIKIFLRLGDVQPKRLVVLVLKSFLHH